MREIVATIIGYDHAFGEQINTAKYKKTLPFKVAEELQNSLIDGWEYMRPHHLRSHDFKMYKSLIDLCTFEIKARLAKAKNRKADEQLIRNKRSTKKVKKLDEQLTQKKEEKLADIQVKNLGEQLIQSS